MRKEKVTPRGTPVVTNPINSGTAEQEQKGVTTPRREASTLPAVCRRPGKHPPGSLRGEEGTHDSHPEDHNQQEHQDLGSLEDEKCNGGGKPVARRHSKRPVDQPVGKALEVAVREPPCRG